MASHSTLERGERRIIGRATAKVNTHTIAVRWEVCGVLEGIAVPDEGECFTKKTLSWKGFFL